MGTRKTFNPKAYCRADGNSVIYEVTHKAHKKCIEKGHEDFLKEGLNVTFLNLEKPKLTPQVVLRLYKEVKVMGKWGSLKNHTSDIQALIDGGFSFR